MGFPLEKYRYVVIDNKKVVAISTYAGKTVRGVAVLGEGDEFNLELGKKVAAAKCNLRVAEKRCARAAEKRREALRKMNEASTNFANALAYVSDSEDAYQEAVNELNEILSKV